MPERESFMKLRSSKAAICTGAAVVMFLMPVVPEVAVAKTTYEQPESTVQFDTELRQASYTVNVSDIVATGYVEEKETGMYAGMAIAIADPYTQVYAMADENSEVKSVKVILPHSEITSFSTDPNTLKKYVEDNGFLNWNQVSTDDLNMLLKQAKKEQTKKVKESNMLQESDDRACALIEKQVKALCGDDVNVDVAFE